MSLTRGVPFNTITSMLIKLLKAKIHRATVTMTDVDYHGSITIDRDLLDASGLLPNEAVIVADCENGNRFETYVIPADRGSGIVAVNGAAARLCHVGNKIIIMSFVLADTTELKRHVSRIVIVNERNQAVQTIDQPTITDA